jgi:hypothetical protein
MIAAITVTATFAPPTQGPLQITTPADNTQISIGRALTVQWTPLAGVVTYFLEFTGPNLVFANPNGTVPDGVNGFGGAGGGILVNDTSLVAVVPPGTPPAAYQIRVAGLTPDNQIVGGFSSAVTVNVVGTAACGVAQPPRDQPPSITSPTDGSSLPAGATVTVQLTPFGTNPNQCYFFEFTDPNRQFTEALTLDVAAGGGVLVFRGNAVAIQVPADMTPGRRQIRVAPVVGNPAAGPNDPGALQIVGPFSQAVNVDIAPAAAARSTRAAGSLSGNKKSEVHVMRRTSKPVRPAYPPPYVRSLNSK